MMMAKRWAILAADKKTISDIVTIDPQIDDENVVIELHDAKIQKGWVFQEGKFSAPISHAIMNKEEYAHVAAQKLFRSDVVVVRCMEAGASVPSEWRKYRSTLRTIIRNKATNDTTKPFPDEPTVKLPKGVD